jgi:TetR/AcrR family fatty acid metabolism transcriptional regulator
MSKRTARKQSILQAAIEVFSKGGFRNSSISEIAKRANVAEGTIYQYYKNKEDLFFSIPIQKTIEFSKEVDLHLQGITGTFNQIRKFIWYYLYFFKTNPEYGRILMLEMRVSRSFVKTKTYNFLKKSISRVLEILQEGQNEGTIRKDVNIYILRQLVLGILEHVVTRWLLQGGRYDLMEYYDDITKLVIEGVGLPRRAHKLSEVSKMDEG